MPSKKIKFVFFGSDDVAAYILDPLREKGFVPNLIVDSARAPLDIDALKAIGADVFIVASFGKILPQDIIDMPKYGTLNIHPSLLPKLRGTSPIRTAIIQEDETGVTIIKMDEQMDHGPILATKKVSFETWPDKHSIVEKKLWSEGGRMLADILPDWIEGKVTTHPQSDSEATFTKLIKKSDADITNDPPELAYRKVLAYEGWPRARRGDLIITEAHVENGELILDKVIPPGKREMDYKDYLRGRPVR
ncbi:MAG: methionyl-tRNA formyltransferase, methionyl-tRNA formyltransferase [Parcubacteria group bacterium]|nr:methionyl-tRNA formyltransferase, methionyl-tRNA formyltransferase [Parcubacteria group bacterium]